MGKEGEEEGRLHVVMFPWLGMGHITPFLYLSKCLAQRGHRVSFISTPRNLQKLLLPTIPPNIHLVSLPLPRVDDNLPKDAESSMDIPPHKAQFLKLAFDSLKLPVSDFLENASPRPDWIIYDYASHWVPSLAARFGVSRAYFSLFSAATMAYIGPPWALLNPEHARSRPEDCTVAPKWVPFESDVAYRLREVMRMRENDAGGNQSGAPGDDIRFGVSIEQSDVVFIRTCAKFEFQWLNLLRELYGKPVVPVGVLPPLLKTRETDHDHDDKDEDDGNWVVIKKWLDKQGTNSVVYVAMGTEATLTQVEFTELAHGLEQSEIPFFWVLRKPPPGSDSNGSNLLPDGFRSRTAQFGFVYEDWAPQARILSHSAIGGFLTHCGWNSVIEGLSLGRALILLPLANDQGLNARLLEGKGLGVEVPRNEEDGSLHRESVAETVKLVMVGEEGKRVRDNAREMKGLFGSKHLNDIYVDGFVGCLEEGRASSRDRVRA